MVKDSLVEMIKRAQNQNDKIRAIKKILEKEHYAMENSLLYKGDEGRKLLYGIFQKNAHIDSMST